LRQAETVRRCDIVLSGLRGAESLKTANQRHLIDGMMPGSAWEYCGTSQRFRREYDDNDVLLSFGQTSMGSTHAALETLASRFDGRAVMRCEQALVSRP